jgi:hypothetical protein
MFAYGWPDSKDDPRFNQLKGRLIGSASSIIPMPVCQFIFKSLFIDGFEQEKCSCVTPDVLVCTDDDEGFLVASRTLVKGRHVNNNPLPPSAYDLQVPLKAKDAIPSWLTILPVESTDDIFDEVYAKLGSQLSTHMHFRQRERIFSDAITGRYACNFERVGRHAFRAIDRARRGFAAPVCPVFTSDMAIKIAFDRRAARLDAMKQLFTKSEDVRQEETRARQAEARMRAETEREREKSRREQADAFLKATLALAASEDNNLQLMRRHTDVYTPQGKCNNAITMQRESSSAPYDEEVLKNRFAQSNCTNPLLRDESTSRE